MTQAQRPSAREPSSQVPRRNSRLAAHPGMDLWWIIVAGALVAIGAAVWLAPPSHRLLVSGLALVAFAIALGVDWVMTSSRSPALFGTAAAERGSQVGSPDGITVPLVQAESAAPAAIAGGTAAVVPMSVVAFSQPKDGNSDAENEDSHAVDVGWGVAAVSDGASSSICSGEWAAALTTAFVTERPTLTGKDIRAFLGATARDFASRPVDTGDGWWGEAASRSDSFATFLGFRATRLGDGVAWEAAAIGDSVVVQLRREASGLRLVEAFPTESSAGLEGAPNLVGSESAREGRLPAIRLASGTGLVTDSWLLLTDEIAKWAFRGEEKGHPVWALLADAASSGLGHTIAMARAAGEMANDDITVVGLTPLPAQP